MGILRQENSRQCSETERPQAVVVRQWFPAGLVASAERAATIEATNEMSAFYRFRGSGVDRASSRAISYLPHRLQSYEHILYRLNDQWPQYTSNQTLVQII